MVLLETTPVLHGMFRIPILRVLVRPVGIGGIGFA
jgi:hypothetical protein